MKIEKKYQGTIPTNKILNEKTESNTDTYSCEYINGLSTGGNGNGEVGVVLFESTEEYGNNGEIQLLDNVRNYKYIDITFGLNTTKEISRIDATSQTFGLNRILSVNNMLFFRNTTYNLLDTSITVKDYSSMYTNSEKQMINEKPTASVLGVYKVVGYK